MVFIHQCMLSILLFQHIRDGQSFSISTKNLALEKSSLPIYSSLRNLQLKEYSTFKKKYRLPSSLFMGIDDYGDDDDDDYDVDIELGDWRKFRMTLAETGIKTPEAMNTADEEGSSSSQKEQDNKIQAGKRPKSVSKKNEELLQNQNRKLAEEYLSGVWAHEVPEPEVGGLVCRLPIEAEIWRSKNTNAIGRKLQKQLNSDENSEKKKSALDLAAKTTLWYRGASNLVKNELKLLEDLSEDGVVDADLLTPEGLELAEIFNDNMEKWQEVCLILDRTLGTKTKTVTINRPMAFKVNEPLAKLLLFGASSSVMGNVQVSQTETYVKFLTAFENECAVYVGGPHGQRDPAEIIHGISDLEGCVEIGEGTGIYRGGMKAAVDGVLKGRYKPLEFRFFVGSHEYKSGELEQKVRLGKYQSIACARSLALKQCISLPKPLWHEVMELCGGELREISALELSKRNDIEAD